MSEKDKQLSRTAEILSEDLSKLGKEKKTKTKSKKPKTKWDPNAKTMWNVDDTESKSVEKIEDEPITPKEIKTAFRKLYMQEAKDQGHGYIGVPKVVTEYYDTGKLTLKLLNLVNKLTSSSNTPEAETLREYFKLSEGLLGKEKKESSKSNDDKEAEKIYRSLKSVEEEEEEEDDDDDPNAIYTLGTVALDSKALKEILNTFKNTKEQQKIMDWLADLVFQKANSDLPAKVRNKKRTIEGIKAKIADYKDTIMGNDHANSAGTTALSNKKKASSIASLDSEDEDGRSLHNVVADEKYDEEAKSDAFDPSKLNIAESLNELKGRDDVDAVSKTKAKKALDKIANTDNYTELALKVSEHITPNTYEYLLNKAQPEVEARNNTGFHKKEWNVSKAEQGSKSQSFTAQQLLRTVQASILQAHINSLPTFKNTRDFNLTKLLTERLGLGGTKDSWDNTYMPHSLQFKALGNLNAKLNNELNNELNQSEEDAK